MAVTMARHVESVAESGAAFIVATHQGVVEPHSICHRKWSRIVAITTACLMEPVMGSDGAAQNPSQEVEQSRGRYYGLSATEIRKEFVHNGTSGEGLRWESGTDCSW